MAFIDSNHRSTEIVLGLVSLVDFHCNTTTADQFSIRVADLPSGEFDWQWPAILTHHHQIFVPDRRALQVPRKGCLGLAKRVGVVQLQRMFAVQFIFAIAERLPSPRVVRAHVAIRASAKDHYRKFIEGVWQCSSVNYSWCNRAIHATQLQSRASTEAEVRPQRIPASN